MKSITLKFLPIYDTAPISVENHPSLRQLFLFWKKLEIAFNFSSDVDQGWVKEQFLAYCEQGIMRHKVEEWATCATLGPWFVQKSAKSECTSLSTLFFVVSVVKERVPVHHGGLIYSILNQIAFPFKFQTFEMDDIHSWRPPNRLQI